MVAQRSAEVIWERDLLSGSGKVSFGSKAIQDTAVTWASRTEQPNGKTSPEELLAAAHASCFAMAFSGKLAANGTPPTKLDVSAVSTFDKLPAGWKVTTVQLTVKGWVPGLDSGKFVELAKAAEASCPISNALRNNVQIDVSASLA